MDENLSCRVCLGDYDSGNHSPVLLPACGHTFCSFCIEQLYWQNKRACPECRKANAVQRASSLPVNYSLLSIAEAKQQKNSKRDVTQPSSPPRPKKPSPSESPLTAPRHSVPVPGSRLPSNHSLGDRIGGCSSATVPSSQASSPPPLARARRSGSTNSVNAIPSSSGVAVAGVRARPPLSSVRRSRSQHSPGDVADLTSSLSRLQISGSGSGTAGGRRPQHSPHRTPHSREHHKSLQEELDFQMAVHLTFCKDPTHRHDDHTGHSGRCWHYPGDHDLHTALTLAHSHQD